MKLNVSWNLWYMDRRRHRVRGKMYWKKLEDSSLHIDFALIVTNLPCSDAEALLIPDGCLILIQNVLVCKDQTAVLDESCLVTE